MLLIGIFCRLRAFKELALSGNIKGAGFLTSSLDVPISGLAWKWGKNRLLLFLPYVFSSISYSVTPESKQKEEKNEIKIIVIIQYKLSARQISLDNLW